MPSRDPVAEFRGRLAAAHHGSWVEPTLVDLLAKASPLLIHGSAFTKAIPMGCLASHVAWNHPETCRHQQEAGVVWLTKIAGLQSRNLLSRRCMGS